MDSIPRGKAGSWQPHGKPSIILGLQSQISNTQQCPCLCHHRASRRKGGLVSPPLRRHCSGSRWIRQCRSATGRPGRSPPSSSGMPASMLPSSSSSTGTLRWPYQTLRASSQVTQFRIHTQQISPGKATETGMVAMTMAPPHLLPVLRHVRTLEIPLMEDPLMSMKAQIKVMHRPGRPWPLQLHQAAQRQWLREASSQIRAWGSLQGGGRLQRQLGPAQQPSSPLYETPAITPLSQRLQQPSLPQATPHSPPSL